MSAGRATFGHSFPRIARGVRRRLAARWILSGGTLGALASAPLVGAAWWIGADTTPVAITVFIAGLCAGTVIATRRRWSDENVALYLDARLDEKELLTTALELDDGSARSLSSGVISRAGEVLHAASTHRAKPSMFRRHHLLALLGGGAALGIALSPPRPPPPPTVVDAPPAVTALDPLVELEALRALSDLPGRDPEQTRRLRDIAEKARLLQSAMATGMERREAMAKLAELRDDIASERLGLGDRSSRAGLEEAIAALSETAATRRAAKALGEGDLIEFNRAMHRAANAAEEGDRGAAREALEKARAAAERHKAKALAAALGEQLAAFDERSAEAEALRALAEGMGIAAPDSDEMGGAPEASRDALERLAKAYEALSDSERQQLLESLRKRSSDAAGAPGTHESLEDLIDQLSSDGGARRWADALGAAGDPAEVQRELALRNAEQSATDGARKLGGAPAPKGPPGSAGGKPPSAGGEGDHAGKGRPVDGRPLRAKVGARIDPIAPMRGAVDGRRPAMALRTANEEGSAGLRVAAPRELSGTDRSDVPSEYRHQVGRYFSP